MNESELASQFGHSTAAEVANLALEGHVKNLYLTHISRRYRDQDIKEEAEAIFPNSFVARDFDTYQVKYED